VSMTCTVCKLDARAEIDQALSQGEPERAIASKYGVTRPAVHRHKAHISKAIAAAAERQVAKSGRTMLETFQHMIQAAESQYDSNTGMVKATWFRNWREMLDLGIKVGMEGKRQAEAMPLHQHPAYLRLRAAMSALDPFPEARAALAEALIALDDKPL
jgi:hypothetical protein